MPKGDRIPLETQKQRKADKQRERIAAKKAAGVAWFKPKHISPEQKAINMEEKKRKHREWLESSDGKAFLEKMAAGKRKFRTDEERIKFWSKEARKKIKTDLVACLRDKLNQSRYRAKKKGLEFSITVEDVLEVYTGSCKYLGFPLTLTADKGKEQYSLSIDRIDNSKGYTKDNIQVISTKANYLKNNTPISCLDRFEKELKPTHIRKKRSC